MARIRRIKRYLGGRVDDVVLTTIALGVRHYLGADVADWVGTLRVMVPVSTHVRGVKPHSGNNVTAIFADVPLDTDDFAAVLHRVAASRSVLRSAHQAFGMSLAVDAP